MLESHFLLCTTQSVHNQCQKDSEKLLSSRSFSQTVSKAFFQIAAKFFLRPLGLPVPIALGTQRQNSTEQKRQRVQFTPQKSESLVYPPKNRGGEGSGAAVEDGGSSSEDAGRVPSDGPSRRHRSIPRL